MAGELKITKRHLPHWSHDGATYFITFRVRDGELSHDERTLIVDHIRAGDPRFYELCALVVMPDHVHVLAMPKPGVDLTRMTKGIKGVTARLVNETRGTRGGLWQDESFDRIVRNDAEFVAKWIYVLQNPVTRGLVERGDDYAWLYLRE